MLSVLNSDTKHIHTDKTKKLEVMVQSVQSLSCVQLFVTHGLQNARPPCPSLIAAACSNSCPLSQWCHPTISSSVIPFSSCLQSFFFLFLFIFFYFTILYWFCHTSTCIRHGCTRVPHPEPPSHLPPHTIPLGHPSAPAPSFLYPALNLDWRFISYMILYMF